MDAPSRLRTTRFPARTAAKNKRGYSVRPQNRPLLERAGQIVPAVAALREIRALLELHGKLFGELANQNINFYAIDITESRIREFFDAAKLRAPQLGSFVRDQAIEQFGQELPKLQINFVSREQVRQQKVLEGSVTPSPSDAA